MARSALPQTEVLVTAECWQAEPEAEAVIHRAIEAAAEIADADTGDAELAVMLTDDRGIRTLNGNWRGIDKPTNVLSFPAQEIAAGETPSPEPGMPPDMAIELGDVIIAHGVMRAEAREVNRPLAHHLSHLVVHGALHLLGYDHEDDDEAEVMEALERDILAGMGIPDPYV